MYHYLSFDPGTRTGICGWNEQGIPLFLEEYGQGKLDRFLEITSAENLRKVIIEEYRVNNRVFNHQGSRVYTVQVIGQIKAWARKHKVEVVEQRVDCKGIAAMWSQTTVPKGHMPDNMSAYLHGYYWLHKNGIIKAKVLEGLLVEDND